jgi:hypothetical protein
MSTTSDSLFLAKATHATPWSARDACVIKVVQGQAPCKEAEVLRRLDHPNIVKLEVAFVESDFL